MAMLRCLNSSCRGEVEEDHEEYVKQSAKNTESVRTFGIYLFCFFVVVFDTNALLEINGNKP